MAVRVAVVRERGDKIAKALSIMRSSRATTTALEALALSPTLPPTHMERIDTTRTSDSRSLASPGKHVRPPRIPNRGNSGAGDNESAAPAGEEIAVLCPKSSLPIYRIAAGTRRK